VTASGRGRVVPGLAGALGVWLAVDAVRQIQLGVADAGLWFVVAAGYVALASAVLVGRWPERRRMALLILWWLLTAVGDDVGFVLPTSRLATTLLMLVVALQVPAYAHMAFAYPSGYVRDRLERALLVVAYVVGLLWELPPALFVNPGACPGCPPLAPSLLYTGHTFDITPIGRVFWSLFIALGVAFIVLAVRRLRRWPPGARRTMLPLAIAAVFACAQLIVRNVAALTEWTQPLAVLDWLGRVNLLVVPLAMAVGVATIRRHRGPLGDLVVELGSAGPREIRSALARAIGDPSLELALWLPDQRHFVDENGTAVSVEPDTPGRGVTLIGPHEEPVAALVHDASLAGQRPLLEAAGSAARLALENARLQAELRAQLSELRASRARIVAAADTERWRLERDLHDGAQQRLLALGLALQLLADNPAEPELLGEAQAELQAALRELRELARGIHPAILTDHGLPAAIGSLIDRAPIPITAHITEQRYPQLVECAAYFVVSEALANIAKHAQARSATVMVKPRNGQLVVEISDDGQGGASAAGRGGLEGLADRIGALDGRLTVDSVPGAGTTIRAEIPCASLLQTTPR
jgi:signal transduction histidine kinase